eukprot:GHUV01017387.1.p1 GENE.GHUV01017387.1~~GHUV01017387.1.p1  ORF type:complete len:508 (+),score=196.39 GHUV01017387.1:301-1824(+)
MLSSRPASAQVRLSNAANILREAGLSAVISRSRPASAATAQQQVATDGLGTSWSRPGTAGGSSSSRQLRPQSAGRMNVQKFTPTSRPGSAAAGIRISSRPPSAGVGDATEVGLQRLRDSCAEQRKTMELVVQNLIAADGSAGPPLQSAAAMPGSPSMLSSPRQWSTSRPGLGSRPQSAHRYSGVGASGLVAAMPAAEHVGALPQLEGGSIPPITLSGLDDDTLGFSPLQIVPEEDSKMQLGLEASQAHKLDSTYSAAGGSGASGVQVPAGQAAAASAGMQPLHQAAGVGTGADSQSRAQSAQKPLPGDLQRAMQLFQQRLEQTSLMAQQLLAQQVASQAARTSRGTGSRPGSPGTLPMQKRASTSSRPGSAAQRASAAAVPRLGDHQLAGLGATTAGSSDSGGGGLGFGLTPRKLAALGVEDVPSAEEVAEYATYLGIDPIEDADLLYIAEWALTAPCPDGWIIHLDKEGNEFFYNGDTQASTYEHPMDEHYRRIYQEKKQQKMQQP